MFGDMLLVTSQHIARNCMHVLCLLLQCCHRYWCHATVSTQASFTVLLAHQVQYISQSQSQFCLTTPAIRMDFETISQNVDFLLQQVLAVCLVIRVIFRYSYLLKTQKKLHYIVKRTSFMACAKNFAQCFGGFCSLAVIIQANCNRMIYGYY